MANSGYREDFPDQATSRIISIIIQSTRPRIHISELKEYIKDKDHFYRLLKDNSVIDNLGTFEYSTGWFELHPEVYQHNKKKTNRKDLIKYVLIRLAFIITTFAVGGFFLWTDIYPSLGTAFVIISLAAIMLILADFYGRFYQDQEEDAKAGIATHLSDAFMRI